MESNNGTNDITTYKLENNTSCKAVIQNHSNILKHQFGLDVSEDNQCLPHMYWLPKMHKVPSKERFIIAAQFVPLNLLLRR